MTSSLKKPTPAAQLIYGFKKGGIGCVYQMALQPGVDALGLFQGCSRPMRSKDRQYFPEWTIKAVPDKKLLVAVSGTTPEVRDALIKAIGK